MTGDDAYRRFVDFGRWEEAHRALAERVRDCEQDVRELKRHHEEDVDEIKESILQASQRRVNRQWQIVLAILTAFLLPLLLYAISLTSQSLGHG